MGTVKVTPGRSDRGENRSIYKVVILSKIRVTRRTFSRESDTRSAVGYSGDLVNFEPDSAIASERVYVTGSLGHVDVDDTRMIDRAIAHDAKWRTSSDGDRLSGSLSLGIIASQVKRCYVRDRGLGVVVVRPTDVHPLRSGYATDNERRECVCVEQGVKVSI